MSQVGEVLLEEAIEAALTAGFQPDTVALPEAGRVEGIPGGYQKRSSDAYDRALCLLPDDVVDFVVATQPKAWSSSTSSTARRRGAASSGASRRRSSGRAPSRYSAGG